MQTSSRISINDREYEFSPGETVLEVARRNNIFIPTICKLEGASPTGACRMCVVEVEGARSLLSSCWAPAEQGMAVHTESSRVVESRKTTLELLLSSGDHKCLLCPATGECTLQDLAYLYQVPGEKFAQREVPYRMEAVNPFILRDFSKCILCGRCVQACQDIQVNNAISHGYRGIDSKIVAAGDRPLKDSDCVFCGECLQACPTGAIVSRDARFRPRSWQTTAVRTTCPYCGVGCQMDLHVKDNQVQRITGAKDSAPNYGRLCVKGRFGFDFIHSTQRLTAPLIKEKGEFREAGWEEALDLVAANLGRLKDKHGPDSLAVLSSARSTNEENYLVQKFTRAGLGTNNIDHCARLCHSSTVAGLGSSFGSGAMTNTICDIENSDVILVTGSNTTESHPVIATYIKQAVKFHGAKLLVVDPRGIQLTQFASRWLRQNPGTDAAWINGLIHVIIQEGLYDQEFVQSRTAGFEELQNAVQDYTPEKVEQITGIPQAEIIDTARMYAGANAASIFYAMGITQHTCGTDNVKALANLAMLCGNIGIQGGGVNPLRGQNNVQGACDMGSLPNVYTGYQKVSDETARIKMARTWGVNDLPATPGLTSTQMFSPAGESIRGMYIIGENPVMSDADSNHVKKALKGLDFLVVQDIFHTDTTAYADVVLPACCFAEKEGSFTNTERRVQRVRKAVEPPGESLTDAEIVCALSRRMGYCMDYKSSEQVLQEIAEVTPSYAGIDYPDMERQGIHWPCTQPGEKGTEILHCTEFACGLGNFQPTGYQPPAEQRDEEYPLWLTTGRLLYQYHTSTMTGRIKGLNTLAPECVAEISPEDAESFGLTDGELTRIYTRRGSINSRIKISPRAVSGTIFLPFHYPLAAANILTNSATDPESGIPEFKACAVNLEKLE